MATTLEAALRRPSQPRAEPEPGPVLQGPTPPTVPAAEPAGPPKPASPAKSEATPPPAQASEAPPSELAAAAKPPVPSKSMFDSLEEEMASLLGRPPEKK
jgi:hypothetical protein